MEKKVICGWVIIAGLAVLAAGCVPSLSDGAILSESEQVGLDGADAVQVDILMGAGDLEINGGSGSLLEANFRTSDRDLVPDISYRVEDSGVGYLEIEQEEKRLNRLSDRYYNSWDLVFNSQIPLDINLALGAGESNLDLEDLNLVSFQMQMGAGEAYLDLGTAPDQDLDLDIQGGVGELTVILPPDTNLEADISGGLGEINVRGLERQNGRYLSEYSGPGPVVRITIEAGIGQVNLLVQ